MSNGSLPAAGGARRVVSLVPSLTTTVADLGAADRLVGRTRYCVEPPAVRRVPALGGTKNPDIAAVVALAPDLVLACTEENRPEDLAALRTAGIRVHEVMPRSLDDVDRLLGDLGELLDAAAAAAAARAELAAARRETPPLAARWAGARVVVSVWREPWRIVGGDVYAQAVLRELGLVNVATDRSGYPPVALPEMAAAAPDLVLLPDEPFRFRDRHAAELAAAGVVPTPERAPRCDGRWLFWYGSRAAVGMRGLAELLARLPRAER